MSIPDVIQFVIIVLCNWSCMYVSTNRRKTAIHLCLLAIVVKLVQELYCFVMSLAFDMSEYTMLYTYVTAFVISQAPLLIYTFEVSHKRKK